MKYPRIGFDVTQDNEYLSNPEFIQNLINEKRMKKEDNILYIDYLQMFKSVNTWHPLNKTVEVMVLENNRKCYAENIALIEADLTIKEEKKPSILKKYEWLKGYYNEKCKELGYPNLIIS